MKLFLTLIILLTTGSAIVIDYNTEFEKMGFVNITTLDSTFIVDLKYSSDDNFMGMNLYGQLHDAYLHPEVARRLVYAHNRLKVVNPDMRLAIYDAARPYSCQKLMYERVQGSKFSQYVSDPNKGGGHHNFGCAVDVTIFLNGQPLDMGTEFDSFDPLSHIDKEEQNLAKGLLSQEALDNRRLLRKIMTEAGFDTEPCEWWHFSLYPIDKVRQTMPRINF